MCSDSGLPGGSFYHETGLNPTLDWICALTYIEVACDAASHSGLNPTLDWICALTECLEMCKEDDHFVLILLWTGYVL